MTKKTYLLGFAFFALALGTVGFSSCGKEDEDDPAIVEPDKPADVATNVEHYFIVGKVLEADKALDGVTVSASGSEAKTGSDGTYQLTVDKKGNYSVTFAKTGYISVTSATTIAANAGPYSSAVLEQTLTPKNTPVSVGTSGATITEEKKAVASLDIPDGALGETTDITVTDYTPGAATLTGNSTNAVLMALDFEPSGLKFDKKALLKVKNTLGGDIHFGEVSHVVSSSSGSTAETVNYVAGDDAYEFEIDGFSQHQFIVPTAIGSTSGGSESIGSIEVNNLGNQTIKTENLTVKQKFGWELSGDLVSLIKGQYPSLSTDDASKLAGALQAIIISTLGSAPGTSELDVTVPFNVSGDTRAKVDIVAETSTFNLTFPLVSGSTAGTFSVPVKKFLGSQVSQSYEYGPNQTQHSGGSGQ